MSNQISRRRVISSAAWAVPVITVAVAAPMAAASMATQNRLRFANATATVGKKPNTIYVNTKVLVTDGPDPVYGVTLIITADGQSKTFTWPTLQGWGGTEQVKVEFEVTETTTVTFHAFADGIDPIHAAVTVEAPGWWA